MNTYSEQAMPRAQRLVRASDWLEWASYYRKRCLHPAKLERRFLIANYQPLQAEKYPKHSPNYNEAYMSSVLHYMMVYDELGCDPRGVEALEITIPKPNYAYFQALSCIRSASQQLIYVGSNKKLQRKSRFDLQEVQASLLKLMFFSLQMVKPFDREEALYNAMDIMCGKL